MLWKVIEVAIGLRRIEVVVGLWTSAINVSAVIRFSGLRAEGETDAMYAAVLTTPASDLMTGPRALTRRGDRCAPDSDAEFEWGLARRQKALPLFRAIAH